MITENISAGGFAGAYRSKYEYKILGTNFSTEYNYLNFGGLASYHFVNDETFNVYAGVRLGYVSAEVKSGGISKDIDDGVSADGITIVGSGITYGVQLGVRYFLSNAFAVNAELGYGISLLQVGVTLKL